MGQRSSSETVEPLQGQLRDLLCLAVVGDHVRWVLRGDATAALDAWLAAATMQWRASADAVARHMVDKGVAPDGRVRSLAQDISLNWVPDGWLSAAAVATLVLDRLRGLIVWAEARRSDSTAGEDQQLFDDVHANLQAQLEALLRLLAVPGP